ncbi:MAG: hypothetical protein C0501_21625 [Isosphaera sp.]|nr:hypothetical protein [Isosphaera sp.]
MRVRSWAAGAAAVGLVGFAVAQVPKADPAKPAPPAPGPAKADPLGAMLAEARTAHGKLRDYTGTFTRQERVGGVLSAEQVGVMKVRVAPAGVYVGFARPDAVAGAEVAYSAAKKDGKVRYRPAGVAGRIGFQVLPTDDPKFLADHRHPVTAWGMGPILDRVSAAVAREKALNNPVEVYTSEYRFANRAVTRYEVLTRRPHAFRYAARMVVYVDDETKLPVRFEAYDDPKPGATAGELIEAYSFTDLKFNTGVGESAFDY